MVLQRDDTIILWGNSSSNEVIQLKFLNKTYQSFADEKGNWIFEIPPHKAGGPYTLEFKTNNDKIIISNVYVGDVWLLGGQSNMELPIERTMDLFSSEIENGQNEMIRQFNVPQTYRFGTPLLELESGAWDVANNQNILKFSAVGYFFAKKIFEKYKIPVGLIQTAVGGTPAEAWLRPSSLLQFNRFLPEYIQCQSNKYIEKTKKDEELQQNKWYETLNKKDPGLKEIPWYVEDIDDSNWENVNLPKSFKGTDLEKIKGTIWFRKKVYLEDNYKDHKLYLGTLVDGDETYFNGVKIGETGYRYPPRRYIIPKNIIKKGENTLVVRLIVTENTPEIIEDMPYYIDDESQSLEGKWKYKVGAIMKPAPKMTFFNYKPSGVYNGMIYPLRKVKISGVLWYQGESNTGYPFDYKPLFTQVIKDWRKTFNSPCLPFIFVQLANYMEENIEPVQSSWAYLRDQQRQVLSIPNTAMIVSIDVGEYNDLHPQDKKTIGDRLALAAMAIKYNEKLIYSGPVYDRIKIMDNEIHVYFKHVGSGLCHEGEKLNQFTICGPDGRFVNADAQIEGNKVVVKSTEVSEPIAVRYAWGDNPKGANLYNLEGLPASPFSTLDLGL